MPVFSKLQTEFAARDVAFIGIAIDDPEAVQEFVDSYGIDFTILLGNTETVALSERLGNRFSALPYTVIADKGGEIKFRHAGGMPPIRLAPLSERYLSFAEREEIAILHAQQLGIRGIARHLGRSPSTISRELRRNASTRGML